MTDFEYDCLQKKRLAHQASHKKNGSKSRRCSLSTDHMTEKQWKERNGKVVSVSFDRPTSWDNFKELSKVTQKEYLQNLAATYGANATNIAEMLGVDVRKLRRYIESSGLGVRFRVGHSMNREQRAVWEVFLRGADAPQPFFHKAEGSRNEVPPELHIDSSMRMDGFSMSFSGDIDVEMIACRLKQILGGNASGHIEVICNLREPVENQRLV